MATPRANPCAARLDIGFHSNSHKVSLLQSCKAAAFSK